MKKFVNNKLVDMTIEEIEDYNKHQSEIIQSSSLEEDVKILQEENSMLKECILEMSEIVYGG